MINRHERIQAEVDDLYEQGAKLANAFQNKEADQFQFSYQSWYTKAVRVVSTLAPDRYAEFRSYYEIDPKRKTLGYGTYVIQDFMKNVVPNKFQLPDFDYNKQAMLCFFNQLTILKAIAERTGTVLNNIEGELYAELQDNELAMARHLAKVNLRAAGALIGVIIEGHLQKTAKAHGVKFSKKNPTISDLNDLLKAAAIIDTATWRKISYLADLRNLCSHKKDSDPTIMHVEELVQGAEWLTKNVL